MEIASLCKWLPSLLMCACASFHGRLMEWGLFGLWLHDFFFFSFSNFWNTRFEFLLSSLFPPFLIL